MIPEMPRFAHPQKVCLVLLMCLMTEVIAGTLAEYQWKKRLLVVTEGSKELAAGLESSKAGLIERDVELIVLNGPPGSGKVPSAALAKELRERLNVRAESPEVILLGKDGRTVLRWGVGEFTVAALFARIDAMPMRRQEMGDR